MPTGPKGEKRPANVIGNAVKVIRIVEQMDADTPKKRDPYKSAPPTKTELASLSDQELYDLFGTRYPNNNSN